MSAPVLPLSREDLARRILALPPDRQAVALAHLRAARLKAAQDATARPGARAHATRDPKQRARYAESGGDPHAYVADILGYTLTAQQERALDHIHRHPRALLPSGNNLGKTFLLAAYGLFVLDARAALPDDENGLPEQGARVILPGPDHDTIFETIYSEMLTHAARAEARGYLMPGERSDKSVLWRVRPKWGLEAMSPPRKTGQNVAHTASGRHHRNLVVLIEEGQGVEEPLWKAAEGMASSEGNQIASGFNPTEAVGAAYQRARSGAYATLHLDAFDHPNVRERRPVVPDAVSIVTIDNRVRTECRDRGPAALTPIEPEHGDFVYALPPAEGKAREGARADGILGDVAGEPRVYRPGPAFVAQVRGQWPTGGDGSLFSPAMLDEAMRRWRESPAPRAIPDRVGVDPAREGDDDATAAPAWGDTAHALLRAYADTLAVGPAAVTQLLARRRVRVGAIRVLAKGDGIDQAGELARSFPDAPFVIDAGAGSSHIDHLGRVMRRQVTPVAFGGAAVIPTPGETWSMNTRTQMYVQAALLVARGLVDVPEDLLLREELLAHRVTHTTRTAEVFELVFPDGRRERFFTEVALVPPGARLRRRKEPVPAVALIAKEEVKRIIGRSPGRADAFVLALHQALARRSSRAPVHLSESYLSL